MRRVQLSIIRLKLTGFFFPDRHNKCSILLYCQCCETVSQSVHMLHIISTSADVVNDQNNRNQDPSLLLLLSSSCCSCICFYSCRVFFLFVFQKCWSEDGASPCVLIETPHKELEPTDPSGFKQYRFKNLFIKASPIPQLRYRVFYTSMRRLLPDTSR